MPEKCRYQVLSTKVEIRLVKAEPILWASLEYGKEITVQQKVIVPAGSCPVHSNSQLFKFQNFQLSQNIISFESTAKLSMAFSSSLSSIVMN